MEQQTVSAPRRGGGNEGMRLPIHKKKFLIALLAICLSSASLFAQQQEGVKQYKDGDFKKATKSLKKALKTDPNNAELWNVLGLAFAGRKKNKDAVSSFEKAIELEPDNASYISNLAYLHLTLSNLPKARQLISKSLEINPNNSFAYYIRAQLYLLADDLAAALTTANSALVLNDKDPVLYLFRSDLVEKIYSENQLGDGDESLLIYLKDVAASLEKCMQLCTGDKTKISEELEIKKKWIAFEDSQPKLGDPDYIDFSRDAGCKPLKILKRPNPLITVSTRALGLSGTVRLVATFQKDGKIGEISTISDPGKGLGKAARKALRRIEFEPAQCNGVTYSVRKIFVYTFHVFIFR